MSNGVNKVIIIGRLGQDVELRYMPNGNAVANLSLATSETWKDKTTGEKQERTEWHKVTAFRKLAEIMGEYLKKGSQVYIEGRLQTDKYEKDGQTHYSTKIIADKMQMLDSKSQQSQQEAKPQINGSMQSEQSSGIAGNDFDDDIPF